MTVFLIFFIAEAVFVSLFIKAGYPQPTKKGFAFKMVSSAIFVANGIYAFALCEKSNYNLLIVIALILGLIGDIFLTFDPFIKDKDNKTLSVAMVLVGGVFFLAGHIVYMIAFIREIIKTDSFSPVVFVAALLSEIAVLILLKFILKVKFGKLGFALAVYAIAICSMAALAICLALKGFSGNIPLQCALIAAPILFIISDSSLALESFDEEKYATMTVRIINLGTYFLAQMLFGLTIFLK